METTTLIICVLISTISLILILSIVKMSQRLDELTSYVKRIMEIEEKKNSAAKTKKVNKNKE